LLFPLILLEESGIRLQYPYVIFNGFWIGNPSQFEELEHAIYVGLNLHKLCSRVYLLVLCSSTRFIVQVACDSDILDDSFVDFFINQFIIALRSLQLKCVFLACNLIRAVLVLFDRRLQIGNLF